MKNYLIILSALVMLSSCSKKLDQPQSAQSKELITNENVSNSSEFTINIVSKKDNGEVVSEYIYFDTEKEYINWGKEHGADFESALNFVEEVHSYLDAHPELKLIEDSDDMPDSYMEFESALRIKYFENKTKTRGYALLRKECIASDVLPLIHTFPAMPPTWNNTASERYGLNILQGWHIFNKTFYRQKIITYWITFGGYDCWNGRPYDNNMSSVIVI